MTRGILWQPQLTIAFDGIPAAYNSVAVFKTVKPARELRFFNLTNQDIQVSMDGGVTDSFPVAARSGNVDDIMANSKPAHAGDDGAVQDNNTSISIRYIGAVAPTSGSFYISYWCEKGE